MFNFFNNRSAQAAGGISVADAVSLSSKGEVTVVDVRDPAEIAQSGKAKGAINIPLAALRMQADPRSPEFHRDLSTTKPVAIYCATGARSFMAVRMMKSFGLEAHNIGGLGDWARAGGHLA